jgi:drug/metabolite transporter (DMT)-like permease
LLEVEFAKTIDVTKKPRVNNALLGIMFIEGEMIIFACQDSAIKLLSEDFSVWQVVFIRSVLSVFLLGTYVWWMRGLASLYTRNLRGNLLRASLMFVSHILYYLSIASLPLATAVAINFAAPLFIVLLARPILGERVGRTRTIAVCIGFVGVVIMVRPGADIEIGALFALGAAFTYSLVILSTRHLSQTEPADRIAFYSMLIFALWGALGGAIVAWLDLPLSDHPGIRYLLLDWSMPGIQSAALLLLIGITAAVGHLCFAYAYQHAPASLLAPFEYSALIMAGTLGYLIWGDVPDLPMIIGAVIVVSSGVYLARAERVI